MNAALSGIFNGSLASGLDAASRERVRFVDCGAAFYAATNNSNHKGKEIVRRILMPDRLHPNAAGHQIWGQCLVDALVGW